MQEIQIIKPNIELLNTIFNDRNLISIEEINKIFFGTNNFTNHSSFIEMIISNEQLFIIKDDYRHIGIENMDNLFNYLKNIYSIIQPNKRFICCPYNFYKLFNNLVSPPEHYRLMCNFINNFIKYISNIKSKESQDIIKLIMPNQYFIGEVIDTVQLDNFINNNFTKDKEININFSNKFQIKFRLDDYNNTDTNLFVRLSDNIDDSEYEKLYESIKLKIINIEDYLISKLENTLGSKEFATIFVKSYLNKKCNFDIQDIASMIHWKNDTKKNEYIDYYYSYYEDKNIFIKQNNSILLNFEGINRFLLSLKVEYLYDNNVKEQINDIYFHAMFQLIESYEKLYNNK